MINLASHWIGMDPLKYPCFWKSKISVFDDSVTTEPGMAVFRKCFLLQSVKDDLTAYFSGDCKFRLFINGIFVEDGPVEVGGDYGNKMAPNWWFYDSKNVAKYCKIGNNVFVAEVINVPDAQTDYSVGMSGFTFELISEDKTLLCSDNTWKTFRNPAFRATCFIDASRFSKNYHSKQFNDSNWDNAINISPQISQKWNLKKLDLPSLQEVIVFPEESMVPFPNGSNQISNINFLKTGNNEFTEIKPGPPCCFYLRFTEEIVGHIELDVKSSKGATLNLEYQEIPGVTVSQDTYITAEGRHRVRFTKAQPVRWIKVLVYCSAFNAPSYDAVKIYSICVHRRFFPLPNTVGFNCSDENLQRIRSVIDQSMRLCMMRMHWDSPVHQEGLGCTGDYMIESLISYSLYGDSSLAAADILRTSFLLMQKDGVMFHTSYALLYIFMVRDYYMWSANLDILSQVFPAIELVLRRFSEYVGDDGLISDAPNYMFIDWINDCGITYHHPPAERGMGCMTAFYYHALQVASELAGYLGRNNDYAERANTIKDSFIKILWDAELRCFKDGVPSPEKKIAGPWRPEDRGDIAYSVHTNALALAYGLVPQAEIRALTDRIMTDHTFLQPQPYFMHFVFEALYKTGNFGRYGFELMDRWNILYNEYPFGLKECWNCGDYSHAWGGSPAYQLTRSILGIIPLEPGFTKIKIAPEFGHLSFLEGDVPSIHGIIHMKYDGKKVVVILPRGICVEDEATEMYEIEIKYNFDI